MKQNAQVRFKRQRILKALELALAGRKITDPSDRVSEKKEVLPSRICAIFFLNN